VEDMKGGRKYRVIHSNSITLLTAISSSNESSSTKPTSEIWGSRIFNLGYESVCPRANSDLEMLAFDEQVLPAVDSVLLRPSESLGLDFNL